MPTNGQITGVNDMSKEKQDWLQSAYIEPEHYTYNPTGYEQECAIEPEHYQAPEPIAYDKSQILRELADSLTEWLERETEIRKGGLE
jgi:hypothetical protein